MLEVHRKAAREESTGPASKTKRVSEKTTKSTDAGKTKEGDSTTSAKKLLSRIQTRRCNQMVTLAMKTLGAEASDKLKEAFLASQKVLDDVKAKPSSPVPVPTSPVVSALSVDTSVVPESSTKLTPPSGG